MTNQSFDPQHQAEFDQYAGSYDAMHAHSVAASGESPEYFAIYKQKVLERMLGPGYAQPILDFGCGIGNLTTHIAKSFPVVHGYDPSAECATLAQKRAPTAKFFDDPEALPKNHYGTAILANVLHHVPPENRAGLMKTVASTLAPGGRLVIFEHNPWNPVTRHAVAICSFDENAILLYPSEVKRLLRGAELFKVDLDYIVFFPHALAAMRPMEPGLKWFPLGAQVCAWGFRS
ncbi:MAG: class I SAM-dependent methyltransferase [Polyangiaceae bacterium]